MSVLQGITSLGRDLRREALEQAAAHEEVKEPVLDLPLPLPDAMVLVL